MFVGVNILSCTPDELSRQVSDDAPFREATISISDKGMKECGLKQPSGGYVSYTYYVRIYTVKEDLSLGDQYGDTQPLTGYAKRDGSNNGFYFKILDKVKVPNKGTWAIVVTVNTSYCESCVKNNFNQSCGEQKATGTFTFSKTYTPDQPSGSDIQAFPEYSSAICGCP